MFSLKLKMLVLIIFSCLGGCFGFMTYKHCCMEKGPIYEFNAARDTRDVLDIFDKNSHLLLANEGSSPAFYLKYRTPNENPTYFGKMKIKVLREDNKSVGFVTYYMEKPYEWRLLFLAVDEAYRGKGYGTLLAQYAIDEMTKAGAEKIGLWTRLINPAQRIYKKLGFVESYYTDSGFIFYEYFPVQ